MISSPRTLAITCASVSLALIAGCSGGHKAHKAATPTPTPTTSSATSSVAPTPPPVAPINPLTGGKPSTNGVVAVKIDDTGNGRPQVNIDKADIVYIEQVEGGLTRLLAVYNSTLPTVEAVRSVRANDPELVAQYGPVAYVASGGAPNPLQVLDRSNLKTSINDRGGPSFARDGSRGAPYNLTANLAVAAALLKAPRAKSIGLVWSATGGAAVASAPAGTNIRTIVGSTAVGFNWNAGLNRYIREIDGIQQATAAGKPIATPNVIIQFCSVTPYPQDVDVLGNPSKFTHSVGSGRAVIFRNGHRIDGTWSRANAAAGTTFLDKAGTPIPLTLGGAWVVLVANGAPLTA